MQEEFTIKNENFSAMVEKAAPIQRIVYAIGKVRLSGWYSIKQLEQIIERYDKLNKLCEATMNILHKDLDEDKEGG